LEKVAKNALFHGMVNEDAYLILAECPVLQSLIMIKTEFITVKKRRRRTDRET